MRSFKTHTDLSEQTKFRLLEISEIKDYLKDETQKNNDVVENINKCFIILECIDMILIALLAIYGGIGILHADNKMAGIVISVFTLAFSVFQGIIKNY